MESTTEGVLEADAEILRPSSPDGLRMTAQGWWKFGDTITL